MTGAGPEPHRFEICVRGHLGPRWVAWFDELTLAPQSDGTTLINGLIHDQAALHGVLQKLRDTGLALVPVTQIDEP
ncbi:MAG: hypothetical protein LH475_03335 [Cryobacterium sp.]|uniref:hypothetical protein n=1 Tax=unclassified Cryobacterium TaxID=2649013 RepID=UPI0018CA5AD3|nr:MULTISPECIES: hypothetical protein [unclassified Cryobacterium]MCY7403656.1 hypothetical protein [Cryobacterium sp.]MEC5155644.1 hypothetical protein [Cryobacterium sp. CAN_C3]